MILYFRDEETETDGGEGDLVQVKPKRGHIPRTPVCHQRALPGVRRSKPCHSLLCDLRLAWASVFLSAKWEGDDYQSLINYMAHKCSKC